MGVRELKLCFHFLLTINRGFISLKQDLWFLNRGLIGCRNWLFIDMDFLRLHEESYFTDSRLIEDTHIPVDMSFHRHSGLLSR
jgi:hypothetical protein